MVNISLLVGFTFMSAWSLDRLQEGLYLSQSRQVPLKGRVKTLSHIRWQGRSFLFHWEGNILAECSKPGSHKLGHAFTSVSHEYEVPILSIRGMDGEAVIPYHHYRVNNLQVNFGSCAQPEKGWWLQTVLWTYSPCALIGMVEEAMVQLQAQQKHGMEELCVPPSSANGDGGALDMLGN